MTTLLSQYRPALSLVWLLGLGIGALLAITNLTLGLALIAVSLLVGFSLLAPQPAKLEFATATIDAEPAPRPTSIRQRILTSDGHSMVAFGVPTQSTAGYRPVLTAQGYALVNDEGQIIYVLKR
jgi:hypothetical protein